MYGCCVPVAHLEVAAPDRFAPEVLRTATSRGGQQGESCRLWVLGIPSGLPQVDEAMRAALQPVKGVFMRNVTVFSDHPVYVLFGWHCYRVEGEVFADAASTASRHAP